ncbi:MAG: hypothetical protein CMM02_18415 [Rhodopirellula sp.]|nr:hypothetical protein [Rhodopirellula sp.]MAT12974.1 hypothetical protein [Rhodopirellula sp.]|tara:strand:+ start:31970 stop:32434 length:465 start_codon:yes stop_codon:yes gene_type:complete
MAFTRKSSPPVSRVEGEFPELPDQAEQDLKGWWLDTRAVLDRVRDRIDDIEETSTTASTTATAASTTSPLTTGQIKNLYESNLDTNAFTDSDKAKLDSLATGSGSNIQKMAGSSSPMTKEEIETILGVTGEVVGTISDENLEIAGEVQINGGFF